MTEWTNRPDRVYPVLFIDAIMVKARGEQVIDWPIYAAIKRVGDVTAGLCVPSCRFREIGAHVVRLLGAVHGGHPVASAGEVLSRVARLARALPAED